MAGRRRRAASFKDRRQLEREWAEAHRVHSGFVHRYGMDFYEYGNARAANMGYGGATAEQMDVVSRTHRETLHRLGFQNRLPDARSTGVKAKRVATFGALGWAAAGYDTIANMRQGDSFGTAAIKGVATGMLWTTMPGIMTAYSLAAAAPATISAVNQWKRQKEEWWNQAHRPNFGGSYQDTRRAQTMRQAAIEAIQGSKLNARSALGGEARILSQGMYRG